jgi:hypothetical protein
MASTVRSTSASEVDQLLTLMRIAAMPCQTVLPIQGRAICLDACRAITSHPFSGGRAYGRQAPELTARPLSAASRISVATESAEIA